ncbi:alpha/beta-hydrolase [Trematosphaeria pertusa]|uniref:Alpha/beta-hydrolase n=1 Tax=Trematosphaeria pertusa TaxID=390896 RepID=A0A6A6HUB1_9PLEO|nr:alpha/beta-hydrolase [Trematosphaeria pertusa]KAF2241764.1 alpha/beta-hydrolase [Trematosphaeria pertusa]
MSHSTTAFLFVPGAWCPSTYYSKVVSLLTAQGYTAFAFNLPSCGKKDTVPTFADDVTHIRSHATSLLDAGKDVVIVGNSYGGFVTLESCKGLAKKDREADGKTGGTLKGIILIGSFLAEVGNTMKELTAGHVPLPPDLSDPWIEPVPGDAGYRFLCGSLPEEEGLKWGNMVRAQCVAPFVEPLTYAAYEEVPTTMVIGGKDVALPPDVQHESFRKAEERGAKGLRKVVIEGADHCAMLNSPEEVARVCVEAAE